MDVTEEIRRGFALSENKKIKFWMALILIMLSVFAFIVYNQHKKTQLRKEKQELILAERRRIESELEDWISQYDVIDLATGGYNLWEEDYTLNIIESLIDSNNKLILFRGNIVDLYPDNGSYYGILEFWADSISTKGHLSWLEFLCNADQVASLRNLASFKDIYVIADVHAIQRADLMYGDANYWIGTANLLYYGNMIDFKVEEVKPLAFQY